MPKMETNIITDSLSAEELTFESRTHGRFTLGELMRLELDGKNQATGRYDAILWKIRSGYVVALYTGLAFLVGKKLDIHGLHVEHLLVAYAFSLIAYMMDREFRIRQLRVVVARDKLIDQAMKQSLGKEVDVELVRTLLFIAGESHHLLDAEYLKRKLRPIKLFYLTTPFLIALGYLIANVDNILNLLGHR